MHYLLGLILIVWIVIAIDLLIGIRKIEKLESTSALRDGPLVSIVIAAKNEADYIRRSIESQLQQTYRNIQWVLVNDRSSDGTGTIMDEMAKNHPQLSVIHIERLPDGWLGKNHALYKGFQQADGELILFTDADVVFEKHAVGKAVNYMIKNKIDHLTAAPDLKAEPFWLKTFVAFFLFGFSYYKRPWKANDDRSKIGIGIGAFNLIRSSVYSRIGTHEEIKACPDEDLQLGMLVKRFGYKQRMSTGLSLLQVEWYPSLLSALKGLEKNTFAGFNYQAAMVVFAIAAVFISQVLPFFLIFTGDGWSKLLSVIVIALLFFLYKAVIKKMTNFSPWLFLVFPFTACLFLYSILRATFLTFKRGGIEWRGTMYSLKELRRHRRH
ncbi:glycosyltransferase [Falsibacillus albus]|uniref:Glycosyltransferase n=1 Tax=Falsibacillus albus TaxID=2478915 RepID=A0A3L7JLF3_9BACI|nr:glycosyltransferase family 2 protein [Falsibacillus albus]RLQ91135.1 glycosyltransferase [Falsibacillus albus]